MLECAVHSVRGILVRRAHQEPVPKPLTLAQYRAKPTRSRTPFLQHAREDGNRAYRVKAVGGVDDGVVEADSRRTQRRVDLAVAKLLAVHADPARRRNPSSRVDEYVDGQRVVILDAVRRERAGSEQEGVGRTGRDGGFRAPAPVQFRSDDVQSAPYSRHQFTLAPARGVLVQARRRKPAQIGRRPGFELARQYDSVAHPATMPHHAHDRE